MADQTRALTGWGGTAPTVATVCTPTTLLETIAEVRRAPRRGLIARGLARSYGDAAQNSGGTVLDLRCLDELGDIDSGSGLITCQAGVSMDRLLRHVVPRGWFVPVTPGTRNVTLGGAISADVHGKNHHRDGSIVNHVTRLTLIDGTGTLRDLAPADELFWAVAGGMGLLGLVVSVTFRLRPISSTWMTVRTERTGDLAATMATLRTADSHWNHSVAWIDCLSRGASLGRGIVTSGEHTARADLAPDEAEDPMMFAPKTRLRAPSWSPQRLLNATTVGWFNQVYFHAAPRSPSTTRQPLAAFFHPLDAVPNWNRLYGREGFVQYQFVTPLEADVEWAINQLRAIRAPSFLAVLKRFGAANRAPLSFPQPGWTLAVDVPASVDGLAHVLDRIDDRIAESGGRVYLAKDSRVHKDVFAMMYPEADRWRSLRSQADPRGVFVSDLSRRLSL